MLGAAGVPFEAVAPDVDENAVRASLAHLAPGELAGALAEMKALEVSARFSADLVLGSDSIVVLDDGTLLGKPHDRDVAAAHLSMMSGKRHDIISAAAIAEGEQRVWRHVDVAAMHVRPLSESFIRSYVDLEWPAIGGCVGCYRIEGPGAQLFERIEGSQFTVLGMPLLPVLSYLRIRGILAC